MSFFKPEDFESNFGAFEMQYVAAAIANRILQERGVRVYKGDQHAGIVNWHTFTDMRDTHQALLVCIEELPKKECEHEPARSAAGNYEPACYKCNKPLKFKWEVDE